MSAELVCAATDPPRFWADYDYNAGRSRPVGVKHCQSCHDQLMELNRKHAANGGTVRTRSVKLDKSERHRCRTCGVTS